MRIDRVKLVCEMMRQDMTQKKLAELAGVSRHVLMKWEAKLQRL